ncbi:MAG: bifunctional diaminohydroxyphosphoribosylaminopyrimidine deaminase/5-amino-6-(5-phosphoribosylamino)uracil reductase RibD [Pigmentiphaga sp.]|uniref:bifunctional diaminohydroxyphosphoribosylaminopyrimidine deaminase/5-amino-6-(5-phosphoribosylamino)uracil reductase RibD n=1 Tax=Pigmentiphaga sp. TaxID=1977564 RepID=UPI0029B0CBCB|nr:bifunctional diaminohydroxyphosphoribosylaminopyrimidine deaminase/5-amino-6-(5-phosphoribosylamino)uracil reductase RibD [Pigmentiphaga sp.]MDX3904811.1 bifunctional diaminohydroxyphosphoribosylaminopyrimidine deaminase/5-amino-6-(5-phosphoribosylamino)uracil reductase RibD [Pigmentiphaga sp.]
MIPDPTEQAGDASWMRRALALAEGVMYRTSPNPRVGCVIVRDGRVIGEGATQPVGGPHAEVCALRDAQARGESVQGATVYVTLEPCSHHGRTPPCVDALIAAAPARVVVAMGDPNPRVNGEGLARLRAAGIAVAAGVCRDEALALNIGFVARMSRGTPWLWAKMAASLDGRSALPNGRSQWITGEAARADGHHWRARSCAVLTGIDTVLADNPRLDVRHVTTTRPPRKIVLDSTLRMPPDARMLDGTETWIFTAREDAGRAAELAARNARIICLPDAAGRVDLAAVMRWLGQHEINEVHAEAGATLTGALLQAGCVDELLVYMAPMLLGEGAGMARLPVLEALEQARRFEFIDVCRIGADIRVRAQDPARLAQASAAATPALRA